MRKNSIVLVEWVDSSAYSGWHRPDERNDRISHCVSVGLLKYEDKDQVVFVSGQSDYGNVFDSHAIPKVSIKRIRQLKIKEE